MPGGHFEYDENEDHIFNLTEMPEHEYAPEPPQEPEFEEPHRRDHGESRGSEPEPSPTLQPEPVPTAPSTPQDQEENRQSTYPGDTRSLLDSVWNGDLSALHPLADRLQEEDNPVGFDIADAMNSNHSEAAREIARSSTMGLSISQIGQSLTNEVSGYLLPGVWQRVDLPAHDHDYLSHNHRYVERAVARANEMANQGDFAEASRMYEEASKVDDDLDYISDLAVRIRESGVTPESKRQVKILERLYDKVNRSAAMNRYLADRAARMAH